MDSLLVNAFIVTMAILSYVAAPVALLWGWIRWTSWPKLWTISYTLSFIGLALASASAALALGIFLIAQSGGFQMYFDPQLRLAIQSGAVLSIAALLLGLGGAWGRGSLRWRVPVSALGTLAFWFLAAFFSVS